MKKSIYLHLIYSKQTFRIIGITNLKFRIISARRGETGFTQLNYLYVSLCFHIWANRITVNYTVIHIVRHGLYTTNFSFLIILIFFKH